MTQNSFSLETARRLDDTDPLAGLRGRFCMPKSPSGEEVIYFCGNSLGLQPREVRRILDEELKDWANLGVYGHHQARRPWLHYHENLTASTARLVGAQPNEVVQMNTLTVNLHLMMVSFYRPTTKRHKLLIEKTAFPSDHYAAQSQVRYHGFDPIQSLLEIGPREGETAIRDEDLAELLDREGDSIALVMLPGVQYYSGQVFDIEGICRQARQKGCRVGFDLAHAVGNVPLRLHDWGVDFAVWCNYKYLSAGPGAIAGCFVHERRAESPDLPRFAGWWGHDKATRFRMGPDFHPIPGAEGWQLSNPPILSMAPLLASLEIFDQVGMEVLREKSLRLTDFLLSGLDARLSGQVETLTPRQPSRHGCQMSLRLRTDGGRGVFDRLTAAGVVCDWREPEVIRIAPVPLYNTFEEIYRFVTILEKAIG